MPAPATRIRNALAELSELERIFSDTAPHKLLDAVPIERVQAAHVEAREALAEYDASAHRESSR